MADAKSNVPTSVYRFYDRNDLLLYVGITSRRISRQREHNTSKDWWQFVTRQEVEHYPSRPEAMRRERALISKFRPPFNKQYNPDHEAARYAYMNLAVDTRGQSIDLHPVLNKGRSKTCIAMGVERVGNQLRLISGPEESQKLFGLNPQALDDVVIQCHTRRKARSRLQSAAIDDGRLIVNVVQPRGVIDAKSAVVMLRQHQGKRRYSSIKRIDIYGSPKAPAAVRRLIQRNPEEG